MFKKSQELKMFYGFDEKTFKRVGSFVIIFIFIDIFLTRSKASEALCIGTSNYPDLLPEMPTYY